MIAKIRTIMGRGYQVICRIHEKNADGKPCRLYLPDKEGTTLESVHCRMLRWAAFGTTVDLATHMAAAESERLREARC